MKESDIEDMILQYLKHQGVFAWKNTSGGYFDAKQGFFRKQVSKYAITGTSDILGILPDGIFLAIEVKSPDRRKKNGDYGKGVIDPEQQVFIDKINSNKGIAFVASSLEEVIEGLNDYNLIELL